MEIHMPNLARLPEDAVGKLADRLKFLKAENLEQCQVNQRYHKETLIKP
jgi:ubiquinone biosynthesis protein Coq4